MAYVLDISINKPYTLLVSPEWLTMGRRTPPPVVEYHLQSHIVHYIMVYYIILYYGMYMYIATTNIITCSSSLLSSSAFAAHLVMTVVIVIW